MTAAGPAAAAVKPSLLGGGRAGKGGEQDATVEVRARQPMRFLDGEVVELGDSTAAPVVMFPTVGDVYRDAGARQVFVCPNAIDPAQWAIPQQRGTDTFTVGFAGGPGNTKDLELIRPALEWASGKANVEAVIFGGFVHPAHVPLQYGFAVGPTVPPEWRRFSWRLIPYTPRYAEYRTTLSGLLDVGLMPLAETPYNRGRSDLKVCEFAMAGTLPIVSDAPNYETWRDTPVLFARDADEFLSHVQWAAAHRDEVRERALAVRQIVMRERTFPNAAEPWRQAIAEPEKAD